MPEPPSEPEPPSYVLDRYDDDNIPCSTSPPGNQSWSTYTTWQSFQPTEHAAHRCQLLPLPMVSRCGWSPPNGRCHVAATVTPTAFESMAASCDDQCGMLLYRSHTYILVVNTARSSSDPTPLPLSSSVYLTTLLLQLHGPRSVRRTSLVFGTVRRVTRAWRRHDGETVINHSLLGAGGRTVGPRLSVRPSSRREHARFNELPWSYVRA